MSLICAESRFTDLHIDKFARTDHIPSSDKSAVHPRPILIIDLSAAEPDGRTWDGRTSS